MCFVYTLLEPCVDSLFVINVKNSVYKLKISYIAYL